MAKRAHIVILGRMKLCPQTRDAARVKLIEFSGSAPLWRGEEDTRQRGTRRYCLSLYSEFTSRFMMMTNGMVGAKMLWTAVLCDDSECECSMIFIGLISYRYSSRLLP